MALIYKHLLDVLKVESQLNGNDEWSHAGFEALMPCFASLKSSITDDDTSDSDRLKLLPKIFKCISRVLSKVVNIVETNVLHERLATIVIESLCSILKELRKRILNHSLVQSIFIEDQASIVMVILHVLAILESLSPDRRQSHDEALTAAALDAFSQILQALYNISSVDDLTIEKRRNLSTHRLSASFESSLGSQAVLALLGLCKHRSKRIATAAADDLLLCMTCFSDFTHMWRSCFPGTFSGLFVLSQSGFKSGSVLLGKAVLCLLRLLRNVGADSLPENRQLQQCLAAASPGLHGKGAGLAQLQNKLTGTARLKEISTSDSAAAMATPSVAQGTDTVAQYAQWRVDVLQHIQLPVTAAFREALKLGSPTLRTGLVRGLAAALQECAAFLGARCVTDCTVALLASAADGTSNVRAAALQSWADVSETLRSGEYTPSDAFMNVMNGLGEKYMVAVKNASTAAALGNDSKLRELLATVIGVGAGLQERLLAVVRLGDNAKVLVRCVGALLAPEPSVCSLRGVTASVLETRRYCCVRAHLGAMAAEEVASVEAGYHRVAWRGPQEVDCRDLAYRTALSIGRNGLLEEVFRRSRKALQRLRGHADDEAGVQVGESGARQWAEQFSAAAGALFFCNIAVQGIASVAVMHRSPVSFEASSKQKRLVCAHCGLQETSSSTSSMLRCSRCKDAHYCCKEHQVKHWSAHKEACIPQKASTAMAQQKAGADSDSLQAADPDNPTALLTSSLLAIVSDSASRVGLVGEANSRWVVGYTSLYPVGKARYLVQAAVQHYLDVLAHYLSLRSASTTVVQSSTSGAGTAAFVLLAAGAAEGLANLAFAAGPSVFAAHMRQILYPLLELLVDAEPIARQAGRSSLNRIALYGQHRNLAALVRSNLDYIVDTVCRELRAPTTTVSNTTTALIVDFVFSILDTTVESFDGAADNWPYNDQTQSSLTPMFLLRDVICDALGSVDSFSIESTYCATQLQALLCVLRVLANRAAPAPALATLPATILALPQHVALSQPAATKPAASSVVATAASLLDFTRNLLNLRQFESPDVVADGTDSDLFSARPKEGEQEDEEDEDPTNTKPAPPAVQLLLDVLQRCCLFLTLPHTSSQLLVLDTMSAAFLRLSLPQHVTFLLPCVHTTWPVIINRVKELRQIICQRGEGALAAGSNVKGRRRVLASSSALLSLEKVETQQPASLLLLRSATANQEPIACLSSAGTGTPPSQEVSRALALPGIFELIGVITAACTNFMTIKLKQELLPEVFGLLAHYGLEYLHSSAASSGQPAPTRPQLLPASVSVPREPTPVATPAQSLSRFSIDSKVKCALLRMLRHFCTVEEGVTRVMREFAGVLAYQSLPLLGTRETAQVREEAVLLLQTLRRLDMPTVCLIAKCVAYHINSTEQWLAVAHSPLIVAAFNSTGTSSGSRRMAPNAEDLLRKLRSDPAVYTALDSAALQSKQSLELSFTETGLDWCKNLERWAAV